MTERLRFAPSPTGPLHIGGLRTALYNYLYAKKHQGVVVLRIEDTDQSRYVDGAEDYIVNALKWLGIDSDESPGKGGAYGPYRQSERQNFYKDHIQKLIDNGKAYYAFDSVEALDKLRAEASAQGKTFTYNAQVRGQLHNSLNCKPVETEQLTEKGSYVIRLKVEPHETVVVNDALRGKIVIDSATLDDKVLIKADGFPTYHFANVVDDHLMKITTVIRGEEWLPSLAIHQLIYNAFKWKAPKFIHLPLILKSEGKGKLSKRDGIKGGFPVFPLDWEQMKGFKETGFLPEALRNFLLLIGWNSGTTKELFTKEEMIAAFAIEGLQKGGGRFDYNKALWMNEQYLQNLSLIELQKAGSVLLEPLKKKYDEDLVHDILQLLQPRIKLIEDLKETMACFLAEPSSYDTKALKKLAGRLPLAFFQWSETALLEIKSGEIKGALHEWCEANNCGLGIVMQTFRLAIVGTLAGPDIIEVIRILGTDEVLKRLRKLKEVIIN